MLDNNSMHTGSGMCYIQSRKFFSCTRKRQSLIINDKTALPLPSWACGPGKIYKVFTEILYLCCCSVAEACLTVFDPMDCNTPGFPVLHYLLEFAQTHVHWVDDAIQPSHPLLTASPPAFNLFQHQSLFQWIGSSYQVAKLLELQLQHQSFQWLTLRLTGLISLQSKEFSRVFPSTTIQKHQFFGIQHLYGPTLTS